MEKYDNMIDLMFELDSLSQSINYIKNRQSISDFQEDQELFLIFKRYHTTPLQEESYIASKVKFELLKKHYDVDMQNILANRKCNKILTRGKRKGQECGDYADDFFSQSSSLSSSTHIKHARCSKHTYSDQENAEFALQRQQERDELTLGVCHEAKLLFEKEKQETQQKEERAINEVKEKWALNRKQQTQDLQENQEKFEHLFRQLQTMDTNMADALTRRFTKRQTKSNEKWKVTYAQKILDHEKCKTKFTERCQKLSTMSEKEQEIFLKQEEDEEDLLHQKCVKDFMEQRKLKKRKGDEQQQQQQQDDINL